MRKIDCLAKDCHELKKKAKLGQNHIADKTGSYEVIDDKLKCSDTKCVYMQKPNELGRYTTKILYLESLRGGKF